ncbi:hypothetical protein [Psychrobacter sp. 1044]|uniref:hypothetical protein n=1 Tax=Psychrobacter sp. 1044 TaxID=2772562 RepID=UPI0019185C48|nr:hypothetical protein [Psychrobacter sp. 1044]
MQKISIRHKLLIIAVLSGFSNAAIAASFANMDDYVWETIEAPIYPNWGKDCNSEDERIYQDCLDKSLMIYNQNLIEKLQLSKYISRQLNQTTITIPSHESPVILTDKSVQDENGDSLRYVYLINSYDKNKNWLYLSGQAYETNNTVLVDLNTGVIQEFEGSHLTFSPDMTYAATVKVEFPEEEEVIIWKKDKYGSYQYDKNNMDYGNFRQHFKFYDSRKYSPMPYSAKLEWVTNDSLLVDFYFNMSEHDTITYRVRFNYVKTEPASDWQMIPIK